MEDKSVNNPKAAETENWICTNCGGTLKWNIQKQQFECVSCRAAQEISSDIEEVIEHDMEEYYTLEKDNTAFPEETTIICKTCGAQIVFGQAETAKVCPMCGSSQVAAQKQTAGVSPDGIIPFSITKEQAQENFRKWVKSRWFAPNKLKQSYQQGKLDGIYIPFWTFDAEADAYYSGRGGIEYTVENSEGEEETRVNWEDVYGQISDSFDDLPVCASQNNIVQIIEHILPYNTQDNSVPYASAYLSGYGAERYAIPADEAAETAKEEIRSQMEDHADSDILDRGYDQADVDSVEVTFNELSYKQILVPAWTSAFAYGNKQYLYLINGETGKVGGQRPYSIPKILAAVILAIAIILAAVLLFSDDSEAKEPGSVSSQAYTAHITARTAESVTDTYFI